MHFRRQRPLSLLPGNFYLVQIPGDHGSPLPGGPRVQSLDWSGHGMAGVQSVRLLSCIALGGLPAVAGVALCPSFWKMGGSAAKRLCLGDLVLVCLYSGSTEPVRSGLQFALSLRVDGVGGLVRSVPSPGALGRHVSSLPGWSSADVDCPAYPVFGEWGASELGFGKHSCPSLGLSEMIMWPHLLVLVQSRSSGMSVVHWVVCVISMVCVMLLRGGFLRGIEGRCATQQVFGGSAGLLSWG